MHCVKTVSTHPLIDLTLNVIDHKEQSRLILLKSCNAMIGKHELSGQQVASFLCNILNRFTDHSFDHFWWSSILRFIAPGLFDNIEPSFPDISVPETDPLAPSQTDDSYMPLDNIPYTDNVPGNSPPVNTTLHDIVYCPRELETMCLWDIFSNYHKV